MTIHLTAYSDAVTIGEAFRGMARLSLITLTDMVRKRPVVFVTLQPVFGRAA